MKAFARILDALCLDRGTVALSSWALIVALGVVCWTQSWAAVAALGCLVAARGLEEWLGVKVQIHQTTVRSESEKAMKTLAEAVEKRLQHTESEIAKLQSDVGKVGFSAVAGYPRRHG